jgi:hypothetical protein
MSKFLPLLFLCVAPPVFAAENVGVEAPQLASLVETYKTIHAHPELSHHESQTSSLLATELRKAGYAVTDHIGVYPDGSGPACRRFEIGDKIRTSETWRS